MKVKFQGAPAGVAPKPSKVAVVERQGSIPYASLDNMATPSTSRGSRTVGQKRGMGAAERGGRYVSV